jgi:predicted PurR-regulated permease PerM
MSNIIIIIIVVVVVVVVVMVVVMLIIIPQSLHSSTTAINFLRGRNVSETQTISKYVHLYENKS